MEQFVMWALVVGVILAFIVLIVAIFLLVLEIICGFRDGFWR